MLKLAHKLEKNDDFDNADKQYKRALSLAEMSSDGWTSRKKELVAEIQSQYEQFQQKSLLSQNVVSGNVIGSPTPRAGAIAGAPTVGQLRAANLSTEDATVVEERLKKSIDLAIAQSGNDSASAVGNKVELALLYVQQRRFTEADSIAREVSSPQSESEGLSANQVALQRMLDAALILTSTRPQSAVLFFTPVVQSAAALPSGELAAVLSRLESVADQFLRWKNYSEAESLYKSIIGLREKMSRQDKLAIAKDRRRLADIEVSLGKDGAADELYNLALSDDESALGASNPELALCLQSMIKFKLAKKDTAAARQLLAKLDKVSDTSTPNVQSAVSGSESLGECPSLCRGRRSCQH